MKPTKPIAIDEPRVYDPTEWNDRTGVQFRDGELCLCNFGSMFSNYEETKQDIKAGNILQDQRRAEIMRKARQSVYSGRITSGSKKRLSRAINILSQSTPGKWITNPVTGKMQKHKISFVTLTISSAENITAREAYKNLLQPFLHWLYYTKNVRSYIWKTELQERGQIHYHIIFPNFIHYKQIRNKWNRLQARAGYLDGYAKKYGHADPNSTDIHGNHGIKKTAKYMIKELSKHADARVLYDRQQLEDKKKKGEISEQDYQQQLEVIKDSEQRINTKVWDCSENLAEKYCTLFFTDHRKLGNALKLYLNSNPEAGFFGERFALITMDFDRPPPTMEPFLKYYKDYLCYIRNGGRKWLKQLLS